MSTIVTLKHSQLVPNPKNRTVKHSPANIKARAANIKVLGVLQNIVVSPIPGNDDQYMIEAGEGRYRSVEYLISQGEATPDFEYPAIIADGENVSDLIRLAENSNRDGLHPVDEFLSFSAAVEAGNSIKAVANANGVSQKYVKQRMKLAELSPVILEALRNDDIDLDAAEAYTLGDTHEAQEGAFNSLSGWERNNPHCIRRYLTEAKIPSTHPLAVFVGMDAYRKAGGIVAASLFDDTAYFESVDILRNLAMERLEKEAEKLKGWKWVETTLERPESVQTSTSQLHPSGYALPEDLQAEEKRLEKELAELEALAEFSEEQQQRYWEIEDRLGDIDYIKDDYEVFDPDEMALAGCVVGISHGGDISIRRGLVKVEDQAALNALRKAKSPDEQLEAIGALEQPTEADSGYSQALTSDLADTRTALIQAAIARDSAAAYDLGVFSLADSLLREGYAGWTPRASSMSVSVNGLSGADAEAVAELERARKRLNLSWTEGAPEDRFAKFCALQDDEKAAIFAFCVARGIDSQLHDERRNPHALVATVERVKPDYRKAWTPQRDTFFKRLSRAHLLEIGTEIFGEGWGEGNAETTKKDLVAELSAAFSGEAQLAEDVQQRVNSWVPSGF